MKKNIFIGELFTKENEQRVHFKNNMFTKEILTNITKNIDLQKVSISQPVYKCLVVCFEK